MRKIFFIVLLLPVAAGISGAQEQIKFPADFIIPEAVMPASFLVEPLNDEARQAGVTQNPGIVRGTQFLEELYENIDINTVEALHIAMYIPKNDPGFELGIYTIAYRSINDLRNEIEKMSMYAGSRYLYTDRYMVRVWGDSGSFETEVNILADYLKHKLAMQEFIPEVSEEHNMEAVEALQE